MTLSQTAIIVKQGIIISITVLVLVIAGFIGYQVWNAYRIAHLPPVEEKPDTKFGVLPAINFPKTDVSSSNFTYTLDTTTGGLPKVGLDTGFEKFMKVYFVTPAFASLLSPERSQNLATKFGLSNPPEILTETEYRYKDQNKTLTVNLDNGNFTYLKESTVSGAITLDEDNKLTADFKQFLASLGYSKDDLNSGRSKIIPLKTDPNGVLISVNNRSEAQVARISLWPGAIDKKNIYTGDIDKSLVNATVVGGANNLDNYLSLNFTYFPIDSATFATYPTKASDMAFEDLKNGKGVVLLQPNKPQVSITSVSIGYFLASTYSPYLQPIYVFEGPNFVAFVSAVSEQFQSPAK